VTNSTTGIGTIKLLSGTKYSYRLTVAVTDIVINSTKETSRVKLLSGTKCSYRLTVAVTDIVTNNTTEIRKFNLVSRKKVKLSQQAMKLCWGVEEWLLSCI
jgi:hypothetical protein